jgi:MoaA/NifB/PqqE/SkfB family radical SAM enzyme
MCRNPGDVPATLRMDDATFARVESELFETADLIDLRGWGESLILPEFPDRARRAAAFGATLRIVSNLSFRRDPILHLLADLGFHLGVSIDSADERVLSFVRHGANLALIESNLTRLAALYAERGFSDRLNLYVTCQLPALPTLESLVDFADRVGVRDVRLGPVGTTLPFLSLANASDQVRAAVDRVRARAERLHVRISATASLVEDMFPNEDTSACVHPWTWCYVTYAGRIGFCDHLIAADHYTFGALSEQPFEEIWNSAAWSELRREHLDARRATAPYFRECAWCYRNRHTDCEDLVEPGYEVKRLIIHRPAAVPMPTP